jgi:hypothetical protein
MTFDLNEFFAGITLRSLQSSHARCLIVRRNPMPRDISAGLHDYGIKGWQFEDAGHFRQRNQGQGQSSQSES